MAFSLRMDVLSVQPFYPDNVFALIGRWTAYFVRYYGLASTGSTQLTTIAHFGRHDRVRINVVQYLLPVVREPDRISSSGRSQKLEEASPRSPYFFHFYVAQQFSVMLPADFGRR